MRKLLQLGAAFAASMVFLSAGTALAAKVDPSLLGPRAEAQLKKAKSEGQGTVTVMIASHPGANNQVASGLANLGAVVRYREDSVSYIRARVPIDKVEAAAALPGVKQLDLDEVIPLGPATRGHCRHRPRNRRPVRHAPQQPVHADRRHRRRRSSWPPTRRGTAAASRSASSTSGVTLDHPSLRRRAPASARSSTG